MKTFQLLMFAFVVATHLLNKPAHLVAQQPRRLDAAFLRFSNAFTSVSQTLILTR
jgi:hypothetical protein